MRCSRISRSRRRTPSRPRRGRPRAAPGDDPLALPARPVPAALRARRSRGDRRARPDLSENETTALARVARGRLDRVERLLDPQAAERREALLEVARAVYRRSRLRAARAADVVMGIAAERAAQAKAPAQAEIEDLDLTPREREQRVRRRSAARSARSCSSALEELAAWYRDLVVVGGRAEGRPPTSTGSRSCARTRRPSGCAAPSGPPSPSARPGVPRGVQLQPGLALEALFVQLERELAGVAGLARRNCPSFRRALPGSRPWRSRTRRAQPVSSPSARSGSRRTSRETRPRRAGCSRPGTPRFEVAR